MLGSKTALFFVVINEMYRISCWGLPSGAGLGEVRDSLRNVQEDVCGRLVVAVDGDGVLCYVDWGVIFVGAAVDATLGPFANSG